MCVCVAGVRGGRVGGAGKLAGMGAGERQVGGEGPDAKHPVQRLMCIHL